MIHLRASLLLFLISASAPIVSGTIIYPNSTLTPFSNAYWNSSNGSFSMGFFSLQPNAYYVGIWYAALPIDQAVIWTAYRNQSVSENSSLQFTGDGYLQLRDSTNSVIWSAATSAGVKVSASEAEMIDTGNFVLRNGSASLWESFNLPTDTLLPDQNFTASSPVLVSWSTSTDPTPTDRYWLVLEISGNIRLLYQSALEYWSENSADSSNIYRTFRLNSTGSIGLYNDVDELSWYNFTCPSNNSFTKVRLDADGNLRVLAWSAVSNKWNVLWRALYLQCDVFGACGDNGVCDYDQNVLAVGGTGCPLVEPSNDNICFCPSGFTRVNGNCVAESAINCSQYTTTLDHTRFGVPLQSATDHLLSRQDCLNNCLKDCTCKAAFYSDSTLDCWLQTNDLFNGRRNSNFTVTAYIRTVATTARNGSSSSFPVYAIVLIIVFSSVAVVAVLSCAVYLARSRFRGSRLYSRAPTHQDIAFPDMTERIGAPRRFSFQDLNFATAGFSEECKIGSGGFGTVFKGTFRLPKSSDAKLEVAVKRLVQGNDAAGDEEQSNFLAEVEILASIRHINVVNLLGYCAEGSERLLVYEFVANGSLDRHLFAGHKVLDWNTRVQIAVGAATGIEYIHTHCPKKIVHRDIKPANILVDEEHRAKVADFGVSQVMGPERTHLTNYAPGGTPTYMAPECWRVGAMVTEKADAYSFGVVLLEIVSGKRVTKQMQQQGGGGKQKRVLRLQEAMQLMEGEKYEAFADERLGGEYKEEDVERLVKVAFWCLQSDPNRRPSMEDLLLMLKGHKSVDPPPLSGLFHYSPTHSSSSLPSSSVSSGTSHSATHTVVISEEISEGR